ncbi:MAG: TIGR03617 family F420-dependent LLM class oxidoreductase [Anaerolineales bacterium]
MYFDAALPPVSLASVPEIAQQAEALGFAALWSSETSHDPFLPLTLIAEHTSKIQFGTAIAVSFARSPANLAYTAWDLSQYSQGRLILGLGTQVKAHIERRFGMPWPYSVVKKLREQIQAIHTFWNCWQDNQPFNFQGEYYRLNLMSPFFNPGPISHPHIPIFIAGVNQGLARLAGEIGAGFIVHPFHSIRYLKNIILPAIEAGAKKVGKNRADLQISATVFSVTSSAEADFARSQIAFYASTPSYRVVMAQHGWEDTAEKLSALAARGRWGEMPALITDTMLETIAVVADEQHLAHALQQRYQGILDRLALYTPFTPGHKDAFWKQLISELQNDG